MCSRQGAKFRHVESAVLRNSFCRAVYCVHASETRN